MTIPGCKIQHVRQLDAFGCGIACVAMADGSSYADARATFDKLGYAHYRKYRKPYSTNFRELRAALSHRDIDTTMRRWEGWEAFSGVGIVKVASSLGSANLWHWVIAEEHQQFGVVVHDPDFHLPGLSRVEGGMDYTPLTNYHPGASWIQIKA